LSGIKHEDLEILKNSLHRLTNNQLSISDSTSLLLTNSDISLHGAMVNQERLNDSMIQEYLSHIEIEQYDGFRNQSRRNQFLVSRVLAKRCIYDLVETEKIPYSKITVNNDESGKPIINFEESQSEFKGKLSISHKDKYVVVACSNSENIGIDLEKFTTHRGLERRISETHSERDIRTFSSFLENAYPELNLDYTYPVIWSFLEAGFKAFSDIQPKSPLDFKVVATDEQVSITHQSEEIQLKKFACLVHTNDYIFIIVI